VKEISVNSKPETSSNLASALRSAEDLARQGELDAAGRLLAAERGASARILLARLALREGDSEAAETHYREALQADPGNLAALRALAFSAQEAGRRREFRDLCERWAVEDPEDPELQDLLAEWEGGSSDGGPENSRPLPDNEELEEQLTRPESAHPRRLAILEGELLPAPSLEDPGFWDFEDPPFPGRTGEEA